MSKHLYQSNEGRTSTMTFEEIQKDWDETKLFIKILFLMDKLKVSQGEAVKVANLKFIKLSQDYKNAIHKALNY
jgi:hypothetical protein